MPEYTQSDFRGGEVAIDVYGRRDIVKLASGLAKSMNGYVHTHGAWSNRGGLKYVVPASTDSGNINLIPFIYNNDDLYLLEFTANKIRFIRDDGFITETAISLDDIVSDLWTSTADHGFAVDDMIYYDGKYYYIETVPNTDEFTIKDRDGASVTGLDTATPEDVARIYTLGTSDGVPYLEDAIPLINYTQTSDTMNLTVRGYHPLDLTRNSHTSWEINEPSFEPQVPVPTDVSVEALSFGGSYTYRENDLDKPRVIAVTAVTTANPAVATFELQNARTLDVITSGTPNLYLRNDDIVYFSDAEGMTELNGRGFILRNQVPVDVYISSFDLVDAITGEDVNSTDYTAYTTETAKIGDQLLSYKVTAVEKETGHESYPVQVSAKKASDYLSSTHGAMVKWTEPLTGDIEEYNVYKESNGVYGYIGTTKENSFLDRNIAPELGDNPPENPARNPFLRRIESIDPATSFEVASVDTSTNAVIETTEAHGLSVGDIVSVEDVVLEYPWHSIRFSLFKYIHSVPSTTEFTLENSAGTSQLLGANISASTADSGGRVVEHTTTAYADGVPVMFTVPSHGFSAGEEIYIQDIASYTLPYPDGEWWGSCEDLNGLTLTVNDDEYRTANTFTCLKSDLTLLTVQDMASGIDDYRGYFNKNGYSNVHQPYKAGGGIPDYPNVGAYFAQRRAYSGQIYSRQSVHWSATGATNNFTKDEDGFSYTIHENGSHEIRHILTGKTVLLFTAGAVVESSSGEQAFSLANIVNREQTHVGCSTVKPVKVRDDILYIQDKHSRVFDLSYVFESDAYGGQELTSLVPHFIDGVTIEGWTVQLSPEPIIWCRMSDGSLKCLVYDKPNGTFAWGDNETSGTFTDSQATLPDATHDNIYFVVRRVINGTVRKFIERFHHRKFDAVQDCKFLDSSVSYDSPLVVTDVDLVLNGSEVVSTRVWYTAPASGDLAEDDIIELDSLEGIDSIERTKYRVAEFTSGDFFLVGQYKSDKANIIDIDISSGEAVVTHSGNLALSDGDAVFIEDVAGTMSSDVNGLWSIVMNSTPTTFSLGEFSTGDTRYASGYGLYTANTGTFLRSTVKTHETTEEYVAGSLGEVREAVSSVSGLDHLEGEVISALCDGDVVEDLTVTSGVITLPTPSARIHAGLPYESKLITLPLESQNSELLGKVRDVSEYKLKLKDARGFHIKKPNSALTEIDARSTEDWDAPAELMTGEYTEQAFGSTDALGQVEVIQSNPLPVTIQAVGVTFDVSD